MTYEIYEKMKGKPTHNTAVSCVPELPVVTFKVGIRQELVAQAVSVLRQKRRRLHALGLVQLRRDQLGHALAGARNNTRVRAGLAEPAHRQRGLGLAVLAEERRVANQAIGLATESRRQFCRAVEVVKDKFIAKNAKTLVVFKEDELWPGRGGDFFLQGQWAEAQNQRLGERNIQRCS